MQTPTMERQRQFRERHQALDLLRTQRETGGSLACFPAAVRALLQEVDLLQVVAQTAEQIAAFPGSESPAEPLTHLRNSLQRWKE